MTVIVIRHREAAPTSIRFTCELIFIPRTFFPPANCPATTGCFDAPGASRSKAGDAPVARVTSEMGLGRQVFIRGINFVKWFYSTASRANVTIRH